MITAKQIRKLTQIMDGHTIFDSKELSKDFPEKLISLVEDYYESNTSSVKSTIFRDGYALIGVKGVYGLDMLEKLARIIHADIFSANKFLGRGRIARELCKCILEKLQNIPDDQTFEIK